MLCVNDIFYSFKVFSRRLKRVLFLMFLSIFLSGFFQHALFSLCDFNLVLSLPLPQSLFWLLLSLLNLLLFRSSYNCMSLNPPPPLFPLRCSVFLIYQMTRHISTPDISLSEAQELHVALRIADNLRIHTHAPYPHLLTRWQTSVCSVHRGTQYFTRRGV